MATNPTLTLCDKLVALTAAWWEPSGDDEVQRVYEGPVDVGKIKGRKVYFYPASYVNEPATRGEDEWTHEIIMLVAKRFEDAARPSVEQMDEEVDFVADLLAELDYSHDGPLKWDSRTVNTAGIGPVEIYDAGRLVYEKVFWSECPITFVEIRTA